MAYGSFREFLEKLDRMGELKRISVPVATELEITEIADREMKSPGGGKALLFESPTIDGAPSKFPLAINTMGSTRRMAAALGLESIDELSNQMQVIMKAKPPTNLKQAWHLLRQGVDLLHARPKKVKDGPCKEVIVKLDGPNSGFSLNDLLEKVTEMVVGRAEGKGLALVTEIAPHVPSDLVGDPTRLRLLTALGLGELCVCDLASLSGISESATSHQLRLLRALRLVRARREGRMVYYRLDDEHVVGLVTQGLQHVGESRARGDR